MLSIAALPLGVLGDLKSRRGVIMFGVTLWSAATALGGLARAFWQLFVCRALVGVGESGYGPASQAIIADFYKGRQRAFAMGIYSVGMALGGVLGIWLGGVLAEAYGWRLTFVLMGIPGLVLAGLASRLRDPGQRAPTAFGATLRRWTTQGLRRWARYAAPIAALSVLGAAVSGLMVLVRGEPAELDASVFSVFVSLGVIWTVARLVPVALQRTAQAGHLAADAFEDFLEAAAVVLRTPTLIWMFLGGALVTFAVNGLIAWAPSFLQRTHDLSVADVGRLFGLWGLLGGVGGALVGGRAADWMMGRWAGGRVLASGVGFVLGGPVCAALLLVNDLRFFVPLVVATFFFFTWYNGPLVTVLIDVVPAAVRSSVLGAFVLFSHLAGDALAPPLVGYLSDEVGLRPAMLILPGAGVVGGLVILVALKTVGRDMARVKA